RQLEQRVVAGAGHGGVAGAPARAQLEAHDALLGHAEGIETGAVELERGPPALVEDVVWLELLRVLLAEPAGAEGAAGLLVGDRGDQELPALRAPTGAAEGDRGRHLCRDLALHILGAATANLATADVAGPRIE